MGICAQLTAQLPNIVKKREKAQKKLCVVRWTTTRFTRIQHGIVLVHILSYFFLSFELLLASTVFPSLSFSPHLLCCARYLMETFTLIFYMVLTEEDKTIYVIRNYRIFSYAICTHIRRVVYSVWARESLIHSRVLFVHTVHCNVYYMRWNTLQRAWDTYSLTWQKSTHTTAESAKEARGGGREREREMEGREQTNRKNANNNKAASLILHHELCRWV